MNKLYKCLSSEYFTKGDILEMVEDDGTDFKDYRGYKCEDPSRVGDTFYIRDWCVEAIDATIKAGDTLTVVCTDESSPFGGHIFCNGDKVEVIKAGKVSYKNEEGYEVQRVGGGTTQYLTAKEVDITEEESPVENDSHGNIYLSGLPVIVKRTPCRHYVMKVGNGNFERIGVAKARKILEEAYA